MILPIRGGFGVTAINTGSAYFHKNTFVNQAAVNVVWNFGKSVAENKVTENPYLFYKDLDYAAGLHELYRSGDSSARVLRVARPNIVLLVLESFSAKVIEPLGGTKGITPEFNNWCSHGVLFSNIYASDSRTDKGLAAVLSGYPVLEAIPILAYPEKTRNMPFLSKSLGSAGYHASFTYGGDVEFANMKSYLVNGNFNSIVTDSDFPSTLRTGKWGVPDHHVYNYFLEECKADTGRWFKVMMSLSNHEPFEIPGTPKYGNKNLAERYYSSAFYADSCLGDFISRFKASGLWDNTLIIMVADHGTRLPDYSQVFEPRKFHIPMLWIGGALNQDTVVSKTGSQADLAVTLLEQLGLPDEEYVLGKNLLSASSKSFAFYSYKNGIAMITDSGGFGLDFTANHFNFSYGEVTDEQVHYAKTLQQLVFDNYLKLSQSPVPN
jgi:phosphoglycerol transferase MdoB-like AlkP superfamily enzyme